MATINIAAGVLLTREFDTFTISRETLGSPVQNQVRPSSWPEKEILGVSINNLKNSELNTILTALNTNQGKDITLTRTQNAGASGNACDDDDEIVTSWSGMVISNPRFIQQNWSITNACKLWTLTFNFEGTQS